MNFSLCINERWLIDALVSIFMRLAIVEMCGSSLWNDYVVICFASKRIGCLSYAFTGCSVW
jgi:hypothetical protein